VSNSENNVLVRLALLYHDCGKPFVSTEDENGFRHFFGHPEKSAELAEVGLHRLKCDNRTLDTVKKLVLFHDHKVPLDKKSMKRFLTKVSFEEAMLILKVKKGDMSSHAPEYKLSLADEEKYISLLEEIQAEGECISLKSLDVNGDDLIEMGIPQGKVMGDILKALLSLVISEELPNEKEVLSKKASELYRKNKS
jgi:tRNA nucleotidyltransferase (CCA-adding enzyme)